MIKCRETRMFTFRLQKWHVDQLEKIANKRNETSFKKHTLTSLMHEAIEQHFFGKKKMAQ